MNFSGANALELATDEQHLSYKLMNRLMMYSNEKNMVAMNQTQLAERLGTTRPTVGKAVKALTKYGLIAYQGVKGGSGSYFMINPFEWSVIPRVENVERINFKTGEWKKYQGQDAAYLELCSRYLEIGGKMASTNKKVVALMKALQGHAEERPVAKI